MEIKILGISGTPVKEELTNTEHMTREILNNSEKHGSTVGVEVKTELIKLGDDKIKCGCTHCNFCLEKQTADIICPINDAMSKEIYPKIIEADALVLATPVYIMGMSWLMACFVHRLRALAEGRYYGFRGPHGDGTTGILGNKVLAAASVAWVRHDGVETAMLNELFPALLFGMIPVTASINGGFGVGGVSAAPLGQLVAVKKDKLAIAAEKTVGKRIVDVCRLVKAGKKALANYPAYI